MDTREELDIFVSYSRVDKATIQPLVDVLKQHGLRLWWDQEMPVGVVFQDFIPNILKSAQACIVFWTETSVKSDWVRSEANRAAAEKKLLCVELDGSEAPPPFDAYNNLRVTGKQLKDDPWGVLRKLSTGLQLRIGRDPFRQTEATPPSAAVQQTTTTIRSGFIEPLESGDQVGRYQIIRMLGRGGFWIAYQAWDLENAEQVVLREGAPRDSGDRGQFDKTGLRRAREVIFGMDPASQRYYEARSRTAEMIHKATGGAAVGGAVHGFSANGTWYAVSPYARGETLTQHTFYEGSSRRISAAILFKQLAETLCTLHRLDYVHGDVKPDNIIVTNENAQGGAPVWKTFLIDFDTYSPLGENIRILSPTYSAPEALNGRTSITTEIYSLGMVLFGFWARRQIFGEYTTVVRSSKFVETKVITPKFVHTILAKLAQSEVERRLSLSIAAALSADPVLRPQSVEEWLRFVEAGDRGAKKRFNLALAANYEAVGSAYRDAAPGTMRPRGGAGLTRAIEDWRPFNPATSGASIDAGATRVIRPWSQDDARTVVVQQPTD